MRAIGTVESVEGENVVVVSKRSSACVSCKNCANSTACHAQLVFGNQTEIVKIEAKNVVGAKQGDTVELETSTVKTLMTSFVVFLLPVIVAVIAYLTVSKKYGETLCVAVTAISFLVCFFVLVKLMNVYVKKNFTVYAVKISEKSDI